MATPFKMKNSVLHKSATHGSPMQKNYDNTNPNKKDFVSTHVKEGVTVPKKTTLENLTRKQNQIPSEGGRGNTTTTNSRKKQGVKDAVINTFKGRGKTKKTVDPRRGKTEQAPKRKMQPDSSPDNRNPRSKPQSKPQSTTNSVKNMGSKAYEQLVPKAVQKLNRKILNLVKK